MSEPMIRFPPLISHLSCVFVGLFLSYFLSSEETQPQCFLPGKIFVAFPESYFAKNLSKDIQEGRNVYFGKTGSSKNLCFIKNSESVLVQNDAFIVTAFPLNKAKIISELLSRKNKGKFILFQDTAIHTVPACIETKIEYGYEH